MASQILEHSSVSERKYLVATRATFQEAIAYVESLGVIFGEIDVDYPECADYYMKDNRILSIQPEGFKL